MYEENPNVENGFHRRITFPKINWISLSHFLHLIDQNPFNLYPCLTDKPDCSRHRLTFVGKSLPQKTVHSNPNIELSELIGSVFYDNDAWKLRVTFNGIEFIIEEDFLILSIPNLNAFEWRANKTEQMGYFLNDSKIPKYAFKAALHKFDTKYSYIGRSFVDEGRPKFYANSWLLFDDQKTSSYGRINETYNMLFTAWHGIEIGHDRFEVLCLKPSPASLKTLSQLKIRESIDFSQAKIQSLNNSDTKLLPDTLINFLEYPSSLKSGQILLNNEKLVANNGLYELCINKENNLICRCMSNGTETVIASDLTMIHFHKFKSVFYNHNDSTAKVFHVSNRPDYMFNIEWDQSSFFFEEIF
jgi:hypothetical protein